MFVKIIALTAVFAFAWSEPQFGGYGHIGGGLGGFGQGGIGGGLGGFGQEGIGGGIGIGAIESGEGGNGGHKEHFIDYSAPPHYEYKYGVADHHTGDQKEKSESRVGDLTKTQHEWAEKDRKVYKSKVIHGSVPVKIVGHHY